MNDRMNREIQPEKEASFLDYLIVLARHSRTIILVSMAATLLTYLILVILPNKYKARTQIMPPQGNMTLSGQLLETLGGGAFGQGQATAFGTLGTMLGLRAPGDVYVGILTSHTVFDRIIERFDLRKLYDKNNIEETRKKLSKRAEIKIEKSGLISIEVEDESRERATEMANNFVADLNAVLLRMSRTEASASLAFLEKEREQVLTRLAKAEENLRAFSEKSSVLQIDTQTKGILEYIATLRAAVDAKEVQLKVMRQQATPNNYDLIKLETEIKGLKEKLQSLEEKESGLYGQSSITTSRVPTLGLEYIRLFREAKYQEVLYEVYCKLVELARLDQARGTDPVKIVEYATVPEKRSNLRALPALLVGIGTFFIMVFGTLLWEHVQSEQSEETNRRLRVLRDLLEPWLKVPKRVWALVKKPKS